MTDTLFHASVSSDAPDGVLTHLGSAKAAVHRVDSMFMRQNPRAINNGRVIVLNEEFRPVAIEKPEQTLEKFAAFASRVNVFKLNVDVKKPLRLNDCWSDDPIGSGAMELFAGNTELSQKERAELKLIFSPFEEAIYPHHIGMLMTHRDFHDLQKKWRENAMFRRELNKRRKRSEAIKENFSSVLPQETVWVALTMELRQWALQRGYDSFVYSNNKEGGEGDSFVTLRSNQIKKTEEKLTFNAADFLTKTKPAFETFLKKAWENTRHTPQDESEHMDALWCGHEPQTFWTPKAPA